MARQVWKLKALAEHEASLRRQCDTLGQELRAAIEGLPAGTAPSVRAALTRVAVRLEVAASPITLTRAPTPKAPRHAA